MSKEIPKNYISNMEPEPTDEQLSERSKQFVSNVIQFADIGYQRQYKKWLSRCDEIRQTVDFWYQLNMQFRNDISERSKNIIPPVPGTRNFAASLGKAVKDAIDEDIPAIKAALDKNFDMKNMNFLCDKQPVEVRDQEHQSSSPLNFKRLSSPKWYSGKLINLVGLPSKHPSGAVTGAELGILMEQDNESTLILSCDSIQEYKL
jgi:hypothetical protein